MLSFFPALAQAQESSRPLYTIAVVSDGPSWYFDASTDRFAEELKQLSKGGQYDFVLRRDYDGGHSGPKVSELLEQALTDPEVDLIYASGTIATERAALLSDAARTKPIMAGALQFSGVRAAPFTTNGTSRLANYTFITEPNRVAADVALVKRLTGVDVLDVVLDEALMPELRDIGKAEQSIETELGISVRMHAVPNSPKEAVAKIPEDARAVYVPILPRMEAVTGTVKSLVFPLLAAFGVIAMAPGGAAEFNFRARNRWVTGGLNKATVNEYRGACQDLKREKAFEMTNDEPPVLLGEDTGANPVEYVLSALSGCLTTTLAYHAAAQGHDVESINSEFEGDLDLHGFLDLDPTVRKGYEEIRVKFKVKSGMDEETIRKLMRNSPVYDIITNPVRVKIDIEKE